MKLNVRDKVKLIVPLPYLKTAESMLNNDTYGRIVIDVNAWKLNFKDNKTDI